MENTIGDWLVQLANSTESTEDDSARMQNLLHRIDFPKAVVVCGIVYTDGHGTLESPPTSIHSMAKMIVKVWETGGD